MTGLGFAEAEAGSILETADHEFEAGKKGIFTFAGPQVSGEVKYQAKKNGFEILTMVFNQPVKRLARLYSDDGPGVKTLSVVTVADAQEVAWVESDFHSLAKAAGLELLPFSIVTKRLRQAPTGEASDYLTICTPREAEALTLLFTDVDVKIIGSL